MVDYILVMIHHLKIKDFTNIIGKSSKTFTKIFQKFIDLGMLIYENDTYYVKNWSKYQSADKLRKIGKSNKVIEENQFEKSFNNITEEKTRKEKNRKENRIDESNFETLD